MSQSYFFHDQTGIIPGVQGTFSHCRVDIDDHGTLTTSPLVIIEASEAEPIEEQATIVQEQENEPAPNMNNQEG